MPIKLFPVSISSLFGVFNIDNVFWLNPYCTLLKKLMNFNLSKKYKN